MRVRDLAVVLVVLACATPAYGAPHPEATRLFDEGRALRVEGRCRDAIAKFHDSLKHEPLVGTLLNMAECHADLGEKALAYRRFREAEALAPPTGPVNRQALARSRAEAIKPSIGIFDVRLPAGTTDAAIVLDRGEAIRAEAATQVAAEPGPHRLIVTSADKHAEIDVKAIAGQTTLVAVEWSKEPARPSDSAALREENTTSPDRDTMTKTWAVPGYATIGVGAAAAVVGGIFGLFTLSKKSDLQEACPRYPVCAEGRRAEATALDDDARTNATISTVALAAGVGLIAIGTCLVLFSPQERRHAQWGVITF
jgi:hypothetical protein